MLVYKLNNFGLYSWLSGVNTMEKTTNKIKTKIVSTKVYSTTVLSGSKKSSTQHFYFFLHFFLKQNTGITCFIFLCWHCQFFRSILNKSLILCLIKAFSVLFKRKPNAKVSPYPYGIVSGAGAVKRIICGFYGKGIFLAIGLLHLKWNKLVFLLKGQKEGKENRHNLRKWSLWHPSQMNL